MKPIHNFEIGAIVRLDGYRVPRQCIHIFDFMTSFSNLNQLRFTPRRQAHLFSESKKDN